MVVPVIRCERVSRSGPKKRNDIFLLTIHMHADCALVIFFAHNALRYWDWSCVRFGSLYLSYFMRYQCFISVVVPVFRFVKKNGVSPLSSWKRVFFGAKNIFENSWQSRGKERYNKHGRCILSRRIERTVQKRSSSYHIGDQSDLMADFSKKMAKFWHSL